MERSRNQVQSCEEETALETVTLKVGNSIKERRIDKYLHGRFSNFSRVMLQNVIKAGGVKVNGKLVKPSFRLSSADEIELSLPELPSKEIEPEEIPLEIIYEDEDIIVLNKQPDILVHPARGNTHGTLVNALAFYSDKLSSGLGEFRPGIIHRLDKNTTGIMVVAKNDIAQWKIAKQFENREINKGYLAMVHGVPELTADRINAPLGVHPKIREKYSIRPEVGKEAVTFYEVLEEFRGFSLLGLTPRTGRTHQIRVHLSAIGYPVVGDKVYGIKSPYLLRQFLHACRLGIKHPSTGEYVEFSSTLPPDLEQALGFIAQ